MNKHIRAILKSATPASKKNGVLVYSVAIGDDCWNMAKLMVQSLRKFGEFDGNILIYTERADKIPGATVIQMRDLLVLPKAQLAKVFIGKSLDCSDYERVVWMDADVLTVAPVKDLFLLKGCRAPAELVVQWPHEVPAYSVPEYPCELGTLGINTGYVSSPAKDWNRLCQTWWDSLMDFQGWKRPEPFNDQAVFNHLVRHGGIQCESLPLGVMHFMIDGAAPITKETLFVHARPPLKYAIMVTLSGILNR